MNPMRQIVIVSVILTLLTAMSCSDPPRSSAEEAIIGVAQTLFDAMVNGDRELAGSLFTPHAHLINLVEDSLGMVSPKLIMATDWTGNLPKMEGQYLERIFNPIVHIDDNLAVLWVDYDFWLKGKFSHCGVDVFELVLVHGKWLIFSIVDTRREEGCEDKGTPE